MTIEAPVDTTGEIDARTWSTLHHLGRALHVKEADLAATLEAIVATAVESVSGCDYAGVNLLERGRFIPQAVAGEPPLALDALQQETRRGPCIDCSRDQGVVAVDDMATDSRWPEFTRLAESLGVASMLCLPLWVDDTSLGSVSLYSVRSRAFSGPQERLAGLLATHAALALADARRVQQLRQALANRDVIGQAKGILMEREKITAEAAFATLAQLSQHQNRKLLAVATELAQTGLTG